MAEIRSATVEDVPAMLAMMKALHDESPHYASLSFSDAKTERFLLGVVAHEEAVAFVAVVDGVAIGLIIGFAVEYYFGDDKYASDFTFYVAPEHRGGFAFVRLLRAFEHWAESSGVRDIILGVSTELDAERTIAMYERLGYQRSTVALTKRVA